MVKSSEELSITGSLLAALGFIKSPYNVEGYNNFGASVSLSEDGNTLAVGTSGDKSGAPGAALNGNPQHDCGKPKPDFNCASGSGAAYIFEREYGGDRKKWDEGDMAAYIKAPNADYWDNFGSRVSLSSDGNTLAVAANKQDSGAKTTVQTGVPVHSDCYAADGSLNPTPIDCAIDSGAVYLFQRDSGSDSTHWDNSDFVAYVKAPNASSGDNFGASLSLSGNGGILVVSATEEDNSFAARPDPNGIPPQNDCKNTDGTDNPTPNNCATNSGAVYIFQRDLGNTKGQWDNDDTAVYFKAPNAGQYDFFGSSVSLSASGNTLAVGAYKEDGGATVPILLGIPYDDCGSVDPSPSPISCTTLDSGAVYLFQIDGGNFQQWDDKDFLAYIKSPNVDQYDYFGNSVSVSADGGNLAIGATSLLIGTNAVHLYTKNLGSDSTSWDNSDYTASLKPPYGFEKSFGSSVSLSSDGMILAVAASTQSSGAEDIGLNGEMISDCNSIDSTPNSTPTNCAEKSGAVYIFERGKGSNSLLWEDSDYVAFIKAPNAGNNDRFGFDISLSNNGSTLVVGAYQEDGGGTGFGGNKQNHCSDDDPAPGQCLLDSGAVYLY